VIKSANMEIAATAQAGVARISWGPYPWRWAMDRLTEEAKAIYAG
jgi:2-methylisocitrate lyase-like PEP mutase family enzyme